MSMKENLTTTYCPEAIEDKWYSFWMNHQLFSADPASKKPAYSIVIPPPNVTGVLTMGHVLNNSLQDILCRRKRMQGFEVLWLPGTDHAGIATQTVVERSLIRKKEITHRDDLGREKFIERVWEWKDTHGGIIINQLKKLGCSCDWNREVFTMDGLDARHPDCEINYSMCVQNVFVDLYKKGMIYRGTRMINWCPVSRTALSDEEVIMKESDGYLWHLKYPVLNDSAHVISEKYLVVATTRPETMLGDEAVAVHPDDDRYRDLIGKKILLPLQNKSIPIVADAAVEKEFGSGAVKVTPAHDPVDNEIGKRHQLPETIVIGYDGRMTAAAGDKYVGMDRYECREAVIADLKEINLVEKTEPYRHNVGYSERADVPVEPMLSEQWFLKYPAIGESVKVVEIGKLSFFPERWTKVYTHWMSHIRDWCISRQLWWGHRIPAWYCTSTLLCKPACPEVETLPHLNPPLPPEDGRSTKGRSCPPIVSIGKPEKCPTCGANEFEQDPDVLDTWFSAWLWPFATMGWPNKTPLLKKFYPTTDLVTGPDIIFFWVARMIMAGLEYMDEIPFKHVYYTGIIRDAKGRKMSKSIGNSPDPLDLIAKYNADGLRFGLMLIAPQGVDILFSEDRIEVGRNFCNKLWNASRFVLMNTKNIERAELDYNKLTIADKWILNRLDDAVTQVNKSLDRYEFDAAARELYQFVWREFCDWYVELAKVSLNKSENAADRLSTQQSLIHVLDAICRLLHPFSPFITEEIWQQLPIDRGQIKAGSIMMAPYPTALEKSRYSTEAAELTVIMEVVSAIRNIRGEHNVPHGKSIAVTLVSSNAVIRKNLEENCAYITTLARVDRLNILSSIQSGDKCVRAIAGAVEIFVPFEGMVDIGEERERLGRQIEKVEKLIAAQEGKLKNKNFVDRAPKEVVEKEKQRLNESGSELKKLKEALDKLGQ